MHSKLEENYKIVYIFKFIILENCPEYCTNREQLKELLKYIREKDIVYVESYSRLARSTADLLRLLDEFNKKGVGFISDKEQIDTTTPQGTLMMTIFAGLSQFER
jgi:DNA invertase Pin-like site-specific DNA recombinase